MSYWVFSRTFWKDNPRWPGGLEPHLGRKTTLARVGTLREAKEIADEYNRTHKPGRYSRKAEIMEV